MYQVNAEKTFTYLKGMAQGLEWTNTLHALYVARESHKEQKRKSGEPYIVHPLTVACHAVALGIREDEVIAACLLHDWVEDCHGDLRTLQCNESTRDAIKRLTHVKDPFLTREQDLHLYYGGIRESRIASLVKLLDRANNVSTMAGVFTAEKLQEYVDETQQCVLPLCRHAKDEWPEYSNALFALKYHISAVIDSIGACMTAYEKPAEEHPNGAELELLPKEQRATEQSLSKLESFVAEKAQKNEQFLNRSSVEAEQNSLQ